jgi:hypothetical protein
MSMALKKSENVNFWGGKLFRTRFQLTTLKIYRQSSTIPTSPSYLFAANGYILVQWVPGLSRGQSGRGVTLTTHPIQR